MVAFSESDAHHLELLSSFSACDVSDALLRLQKPAPGGVPHAGYLTDIIPYAPTSPFMGSLKQQPKIIGPASTLKLVAKTSGMNPLPESDPGAIPEGQHWVDLTEDGAIVVIEQPDGQSCAALGGILALRMKTKGAKGCVVGGRVRDLEELEGCGLPVWARGKSTVGSGADIKVFGRNIEISIGTVKISPKDIIFCDPLEGVVVIPRNLLEEVITLMPKLVAADDSIKEEVVKGESVAAAFKKHR